MGIFADRACGWQGGATAGGVILETKMAIVATDARNAWSCRRAKAYIYHDDNFMSLESKCRMPSR